MIKVTSTKDIDFPSLNWGISKGEIAELPEDKEAQARILSEDCIKEVDGKVETIKNNKSTEDKK